MELNPKEALEALTNILMRTPLSPPEIIGTQYCIETIKIRLDRADALENNLKLKESAPTSP